MKKSLSKISVVCAACSLLAVSASAQSITTDNKPIVDQNAPSEITPPDQNTRSWSTKHLSATGRNSDSAVRGSRLMGAQVNDLNGQRAGQIQDIILNPVSGRVDFALLSLNSSPNPSDSGAKPLGAEKVVPVPWSLLRARASAQYSSGAEQPPQFTLNCDQGKLNSAPAVDLTDLSQSQWRQRIYSYYGVTPQSSMGGAETPDGEIKGEGASKLQPNMPSQPSREPQAAPPANP